MTDELFGCNTAAQMSLGEAIVRGILSAPTYVTAFYAFGKQFERYEHRVHAAFDANGHLNVPQPYVTDDGFRLAVWISAQRQKRAKGELTPEQIERLDEIGMIWEPTDNKWENGYQALAAFVRQYGTANVPFDYMSAEQFKLGQCVTM